MKYVVIVLSAIVIIGAAVLFLTPAPSGTPTPETRTIQLYYYNPALDEDESGNLQCSRAGLVAVPREMTADAESIDRALRALLEGDITDAEAAQGVTTEFPLDDLALTRATLENGILTLSFNDPQNKTVGGACRTGVLWLQIEATALQFPEVDTVRFEPEELFQP